MPRHSTNETSNTLPNSGICSEPTYAALNEFPSFNFAEDVVVRVPTLEDPHSYVYTDAELTAMPAFTANGGFTVQVSLNAVLSSAPWFIVRRVTMPGALLNDEFFDSPNHILSPDYRNYLAGLGELHLDREDWWRYDGWVDDGAGGRNYAFYTEAVKLFPHVAQGDPHFRFSQIALMVKHSRILLGGWHELRGKMPPNLTGGLIYGHLRANRSRFHQTQCARYDIKVEVANATGETLRAECIFDDIWPPDTVADMSGQIVAAFPLQAKMVAVSPAIRNTDPLAMQITVDQLPVTVG